MKKVVAFVGKGGVGKTTSLVLFLKYILEKSKDLNVLVIDADPDANVADVIGQEITFNQTIGGKMTVLKEKIQKREISPNVPKSQIIESEVFDTLIEMDDFDIIEMGRGEGTGCYCSVNNTLKHVIDVLSKNYDVVLFDAPAGLEHFARRTGRDVTDLVIVTDASKMGFHTMERIVEVSKEVDLKFENVLVLGNKFPEGFENILQERVDNIKDPNVKLLGVLPQNDDISKFNLTGGNLLDLPSDNEYFNSAKKLYSTIV